MEEESIHRIGSCVSSSDPIIMTNTPDSFPVDNNHSLITLPTTPATALPQQHQQQQQPVVADSESSSSFLNDPLENEIANSSLPSSSPLSSTLLSPSTITFNNNNNTNASAGAATTSSNTTHTSLSDESNANASASQVFRGFWKKTFDTTTTAHNRWKQKIMIPSMPPTTIPLLSQPQPPQPPQSKKKPLIQHIELEREMTLSPIHSPTTRQDHHGKDTNDAEKMVLQKNGSDDPAPPSSSSLNGVEEEVIAELRPKYSSTSTSDASAQSLDQLRELPSRSNHSTSDDDEDNDHHHEEEEEDNNEVEDDDDDDDTSSYVSSSMYSQSYVSSDFNTSNSISSHKFTALQWAAASVVDSVQNGYFRGRYNNNNTVSVSSSSSPSIPSSSAAAVAAATALGGNHHHNKSLASVSSSQQHHHHNKQHMAVVATAVHGGRRPAATTTMMNQTTRILGSASAQHMRELLEHLAPNEYIMLLGKGMLGVNLKQSYVKGIGVYVDYLIPNGAADRSRLIQIGDLLVRIGDTPVRKNTILTIPQQIAAAKRPAQLIWATGVTTGSTTVPIGENQQCTMMNHVEIVVAYMQRWWKQENTSTSSSTLLNHTDHLSASQCSSTTSPGCNNESSSHHQCQPLETFQNIAGDEGPVLTEELKQVKATGAQLDVVHRNCGLDVAVDSMISNSSEPLEQYPQVVIHALCSIEKFCNPGAPPDALQKAFLPWAGRRSQGFSTLHLCQCAATDDHFRHALQHAFVLCAVDDRRFPFLSRHMSQQEEVDDKPYNSPSALLMLFVEMITFADLFELTPQSRRLPIAYGLAHKFFLPTKLGHELLPPMFDFHQIVPDSTLRVLESSLKSESVHRDLFGDFCHAAMESLSSHPFISFLVSDDCARMRAYLRNTAIFINVPLHRVFDAITSHSSEDPNAHNYFCYVLLYLLCQTDREGFGEYDEQLSHGNGARCRDSAGSICAALFIRRTLVWHVREAQVNDEARPGALLAWEHVWEIFLAPHVGALSLSALSIEAASYLSTLVTALMDVQNCHREIDEVMTKLCDEDLLQMAVMLADEIIYSFALSVHPKFREHKFHEWLCTEIAQSTTQVRENLDDKECEKEEVPKLPNGCVKRLLRKASFPIGVASHKPFVQSKFDVSEENVNASSVDQVNAECAVVFGTGIDLNRIVSDDHSCTIRRYVSEELFMGDVRGDKLSLEEIPSTLESYATVPTSQEISSRPFKQYLDGTRISDDGWEVSLISFRLPRGDTSDDQGNRAVYGVSLVFQSITNCIPIDERIELVCGTNAAPSNQSVATTIDSSGKPVRQVILGTQIVTNQFNEKISKQPWSDLVRNQSQSSAVVGIALLSHRNVILAMRATLANLLKRFSAEAGLTCRTLVNVLGNFFHEDIELGVLHGLLSSFLDHGASLWLERPIVSQRLAFEQLAGRHLLQSLPPVPLALMFVTAMLEQKIVFATSRRSLLLSASVGLLKLLHPLEWCHLSVPRVPANLAADLIQYPAPFLLGIPSEDDGMMNLIRELPGDVTLVDLDIGRVLLAQSFTHVEFGRGTPNNPKTTRALRSQILYLAQALGGVMGSASDPETWSCDRPEKIYDDHDYSTSPFDRVCAVCHDFLSELLTGTASCSYWIEEAPTDRNSSPDSEPTVVFDEDRFFHIKSMRHVHGFKPLFNRSTGPAGVLQSHRLNLAVSLSDFELIVEVLMQCQSMNAYIASCDKDTMAYSFYR